MSINKILNVSFSVSKVVSVIMAFVLLVALVGGIVMFSSTLFSGGTDYESFEESFAKAANMDSGSTSEDASDTFRGTNEHCFALLVSQSRSNDLFPYRGLHKSSLVQYSQLQGSTSHGVRSVRTLEGDHGTVD